MEQQRCECIEKGIPVPEGWTCGNPDCPKTKAAEAAIENIAKALSRKAAEKSNDEQSR
jgi:hypothetical protein